MAPGEGLRSLFPIDELSLMGLVEILPHLARLANVAPPLIHYYFGAKDNLWRETVDYSLPDRGHKTEIGHGHSPVADSGVAL